MNSEIFFNLSNEQISIIIFDKDSKKQISNKIFNLYQSIYLVYGN